MSQIQVNVRSETSRLRAVLVHSPGSEFSQILPVHITPALREAAGEWRKNPDYLLYDDLLDPEALRTEHQVLVDVLASHCGPNNVVEVLNLAASVLESRLGREQLLNELWMGSSDLDGVERFATCLEGCEVEQLIRTLMTGRFGKERIFRNPAPNMMFARDLMAVVGERIVLPYARHQARERDMAIARTILKVHPLFIGRHLVDIRESGYNGEPLPAFEGGDLIVLNEEVVLIGMGIRTNRFGAERIARELLSGSTQHVLLVELPKTRGAMHLDTVFTMVDRETCIGFLPALEGGSSHPCPMVLHLTADSCVPIEGGVIRALEMVGHPIRVIPCGGGVSPHQEREQWTDGANAVALNEGTVILYERNRFTINALEKSGYAVLSGEEFVQGVVEKRFDPGDGLPRVIVIRGGELSRGRGGGRCLTSPVWRD